MQSEDQEPLHDAAEGNRPDRPAPTVAPVDEAVEVVPGEHPTEEAEPPSGTERVAPESVALVATAEAAATDAATSVDRIYDLLEALAERIDRFHERAAAQESVISRMQQRIEELQGDQVRTLLRPVIAELVELHGETIAMAEFDFTGLGAERVSQDFGFLGDRVERALEHLGLETLGTQVGQPFNPRAHTAVKKVPTSDIATDRTVARVLREGFSEPGNDRPAMYARVVVFAYSADASQTADSVQPAEPEPEPDTQPAQRHVELPLPPL